MKTGIVTFHNAYNYGAVLQAYALQETLATLGHEASIVDYWRPYDLRAARSLFRRGTQFRVMVENLAVFASYFQWKRRYARFNQFRQEYLNLTEGRYTSDQELVENPPPCEAFVCGSDQVWNVSSGIDPVFFLNFAKTLGKKRVSYGPSFRVPEIPKRYRDRCRELMLDIPWLSAREQLGSEMIKELTGRDAQTVVDPVLLLSADEWKKRIPPPRQPRSPYLFVYAVRTRRLMNTMIRALKKKTGLPVIVATGDSPVNRVGIPADKVYLDAGPKEFLELAMGATCVCTSSFHGTAFALVFRQPVYVFPQTTTAGDPRMTNLMQRVGMERYLVESEDYTLPENPLEIDYESPGRALEGLRQQSLDYLRDAMAAPAP
ncbi:MAG: polysaccharide pyruvyl transferase family protein [Pirellulales bacterium]|nr:polysaccharide pyruvyl transferase family protein [Pirellulales bacterium]